MSFKRIHYFITKLTRDKFQRNSIIFILVCSVILLYWYYSQIPRDTLVKTNSLDVCLQDLQKNFRKKLSNLDAVLLSEENKFSPFIGNGYVGVTFLDNQHLVMQNGRSLTWPIPSVQPFAEFDMDTNLRQDKILLDLFDGSLYQFKCFKISAPVCTAMSTRYYAHRTRPNLLIQDIKLYNPSSKSSTVNVNRSDFSRWAGANFKQWSLSLKGATPTASKNAIAYSVYYKLETLKTQRRWVVIAQPTLPATLIVPKSKTNLYRLITGVFYRDLTADANNSNDAQVIDSLLKEAEELLVQALNEESTSLYSEHLSVWNELWQGGLYVSPSLAPDTLNGDRINATIYYILSHTEAPLHKFNITRQQRSQYSDRLWLHNRCYEGHDTFHAKQLWKAAVSEADVIDLVTSWLITLDKQGCGQLLMSGVDGVMQAILLSLGAMKFSEDHLEFRMHPNDLHREFHFRGIRYDFESSFNINVDLNEDNRPGLTVAINTNKPGNIFFACEAICSSGPHTIKKTGIELPVKVTKPFTALLYISISEQHLMELRQAIHVREIHDAPAHGHQVIALHRHGHALGGLPWSFWFALCLLIVLFHVCLCRLLYQEYCVQGEGSVSRMPGYSRYHKDQQSVY